MNTPRDVLAAAIMHLDARVQLVIVQDVERTIDVSRTPKWKRWIGEKLGIIERPHSGIGVIAILVVIESDGWDADLVHAVRQLVENLRPAGVRADISVWCTSEMRWRNTVRA